MQALQQAPRGIGDLQTRRIMWQLVRAADHLHSNHVRPSNSITITKARGATDPKEVGQELRMHSGFSGNERPAKQQERTKFFWKS